MALFLAWKCYLYPLSIPIHIIFPHVCMRIMSRVFILYTLTNINIWYHGLSILLVLMELLIIIDLFGFCCLKCHVHINLVILSRHRPEDGRSIFSTSMARARRGSSHDNGSCNVSKSAATRVHGNFLACLLAPQASYSRLDRSHIDILVVILNISRYAVCFSLRRWFLGTESLKARTAETHGPAW